MFKVIGCITRQHDLRLVMLAAVMCALACLAATALLSRAQASSGRRRMNWTMLAAAEFGGGIWSLHFVAMMAFMPGLRIGYELDDTLLSILVAIGGAYVGFAVILASQGRLPRIVAGALLLTAAIAGMHYTGAAGIRLDGRFVLDPAGVVWSLVTCAAFATAAAWMMSDLRAPPRQLATTALLGAAICLLHFTGMAAMTLQLEAGDFVDASVVGSGSLAVAVAALSIAMLMLSFALSIFDRHLSDRTAHEKERLHQLVGVSFEGLLIQRDGIILEANEQVCSLSGYGLAALMGQKMTMLVRQGEDAAAEGFDAHLGGDLMLHRRDGELVPVELLTRTISYDNQPAIAVAVRDVTERRVSEAALQRLKLISALLGDTREPARSRATSSRSAAATPPPPQDAPAPPTQPLPCQDALGAVPAPYSALPMRSTSVGQLQAISLAALKIAYGATWNTIASRAMLLAEQIIRRRVQGEDVVSRTEDHGFLIWFASADEDENALVLARTSREIRVRFLTEFGEAAAAHVGAVLVQVEGGNGVNPATGKLELTSAALLEQLAGKQKQDAADARILLAQLRDHPEADCQSVIDRDRIIKSMVVVDFPPAVRRRILELAAPLAKLSSEDPGLELLRLFLATSALAKRRDSANILVPLTWSVLTEPSLRRALDERIAAIEPGLRRRLILAVSQVPSLPSDKRWSEAVAPLRRQLGEVGLMVTLADTGIPPVEESMVRDWPLGLLVIDAKEPASMAPTGYTGLIKEARHRDMAVLVQPAAPGDVREWRELGATMFVAG